MSVEEVCMLRKCAPLAVYNCDAHQRIQNKSKPCKFVILSSFRCVSQMCVTGVCHRCVCFGTDNDKLLTAWPKVTIIMRLVLLLA